MTFRRNVFGLIAASLLSIGVSPGTLASTSSVTQRISQGQLSAWVEGDVFNSVSYSHGSQDSSWNLTLHVDDLRGTYEGWSVTIVSSDFAYQGQVDGDYDIPAENFILGATELPTWMSGQAVDRGIAGSDMNGPLRYEQTPLSAESGHGSGHYTQTLPVTLTVPEGSPTGEYVATLTVHTAAAPR